MTRRVKAKRWLGGPEAPTPRRPAESKVSSPKLPPSLSARELDTRDEGTEAGRHWAQVSAEWTSCHAPEFGSLVVPNGNSDAPVHRWFHLKEAYSKDLLSEILDLLPEILSPNRALTIVDPFSGVGTTMLSAIDVLRSGKISELRGYGFEVNPFLQFVSATKVRSALSGARPNTELLQSLVAESHKIAINADELPALSTFQNSRFFPKDHVEQLVRLRRAIDLAELDAAHRDWARLALAMTVEPASRLRRDGRTLRYEEREPLAPTDVFIRAVDRISHDLANINGALGADVEVLHDSAIAPEWATVPVGTADLVLFSPPYPNNIDYTEVYKTELWALSFVSDVDEFREQRQVTLRSHPSIKFRRDLSFVGDPRAGEVAKLIDPVLATIPDGSRYALPLARMIEGYADDMLTTFDAAYKSLRAGAYCVYVVGNSVHGTVDDPVLIASDVMLGRLAELAGFEVQCVYVARELPRRRISSQFVRESVVTLRKPN